jgi:hypothetical protein
MNIIIEPSGRTGNRLFQYALGLILAHEKHARFCAPSLPYFNSIKSQSPESNDLTTIRTSTFGNQYYDFDFLLNTNQNIIIDSYVQKVKPLLKHREWLKEQLAINNTLNDIPADNELVMHIRETDYKNINAYLGDTFYRNFLKQMQYTNVSIVTDNINSPLIQDLKAQGCNILTPAPCTNWQYPYFTDSEANDFNYMLYAKNLFISQSTFSWWAAILGNQNIVYFPFLQTGGIWPAIPGTDDIDLFIPENNCKKVLLIAESNTNI